MMWIIFFMIAAVVYYFLQPQSGKTAAQTIQKTPEDVLTERYVNGEIDEEQFEKMKQTIRK